MATKTKTIKLSDNQPDSSPPVYYVLQITDSIAFRIGQVLSQREVNELCNNKTWKVTIVR